jgi:hypothetical protein
MVSAMPPAQMVSAPPKPFTPAAILPKKRSPLSVRS